jgi:uncharacterized protein (TIGR02996 family)
VGTTVTDKDALLRAIAEYLEEDTPRLMYADYLDEEGDHARAEFIRVQCALARTDEDDPERERLRAREGKLLERHRVAWAAPVERVLGGYTLATGYRVEWHSAFTTFRRGFVADITLEPPALVQFGGLLFRDVPTIRSLSLLQANGWAQELALCSSLAHVHELQVQNCSHDTGLLTPSDLRTLTRSPHVRHLRVLNLSNGRIGDDGAAVLASAPNLSGLRTLNLSGAGVGPDGVRALASSSHLNRLVVLDLWHSYIGPDAASALFNSPNVANLEEVRFERCGLGDAGCAALARSPYLSRLRILHLPENSLTGYGVEVLASSPNLSRLRVLNLAGNNFGAAGIRALARSPHLSELRTLILHGNRIDEAGAAALAESDHLSRLTKLDLKGNALPGPSVNALWMRFRDRVYM